MVMPILATPTLFSRFASAISGVWVAPTVGTGSVRLGKPKSIRRQRAGPDLDDDLGAAAVGHQPRAAAQQKVPDRADCIFLVVAVEIVDIDPDPRAGGNAYPQALQGMVDGRRDQQLLGRRARRFGLANRRTAGEERQR